MEAIAEVVGRGLSRPDKVLPPWLFYDEEGSRLFEEITALPEYYLSRAESQIFREHADAIAAAASDGPVEVIELGAGTFSKTQLLLAAIARRWGTCRYVPIDVCGPALELGAARARSELPQVRVRPIVASHEDGLARLPASQGRRLLLFIGSSIGNLDDAAAIALLDAGRRVLREGDRLLLGADRRKSPDELIPAYDDARGVTAAFNKNMLARINRELGASFDLSAFRHVALWNEEASRIEMHLESLREQRVWIDALGLSVELRRGERIHTESSVKYEDSRIERILAAASFRGSERYSDEAGRFGVHVARAI